MFEAIINDSVFWVTLTIGVYLFAYLAQEMANPIVYPISIFNRCDYHILINHRYSIRNLRK